MLASLTNLGGHSSIGVPRIHATASHARIPRNSRLRGSPALSTRRKYVTFCEGDDCMAPVRTQHGESARANRVGEASLRLCDKLGQGCHNLSLSHLRAASARELLR